MQNYNNNRQSLDKQQGRGGSPKLFNNFQDNKFNDTSKQYMINVISEETTSKMKTDPFKEAQAEFDPKLELLFNRIQYFQQQVNNYESQNDSLKDQMNEEIEKNKKVEDVVNESITEVNQDLNNLSNIIDSIAEKKAFLDKAINQIKLVKLVQMENEFLKNENKALRNKMDILYQVITDFEQSEIVLLKTQDNLKQDLKDVIDQNIFIKNNYSANQISQTQLEQQHLILQQQHKKLLIDYEIMEKDYKRLKDREGVREKLSNRQSISAADSFQNVYQNDSQSKLIDPESYRNFGQSEMLNKINQESSRQKEQSSQKSVDQKSLRDINEKNRQSLKEFEESLIKQLIL